MARPRKDSQVEEVADKMDDAIDSIGDDDNGIEGVVKDNLIPTGITLLNLACSDTIDGGIGKGKINTIPGTSSSGKSFFCHHMMASVCNDPRFDDYEIINDDAERASEFDILHLFGSKLKARIKPPRLAKDGSAIFSNTIQEFKNNILRIASEGKSFIWILDSLDSLSTDEELEKEYKESIRAAKSDEHIKELKGAYNTEKAKIIGQILRMIKKEVKATNSSLNIVQQTRQKLNAGPFEKKTTTSGGDAPFFYSTHQFWLSKVETFKDDVYKINIGQKTKLEITKNKLTGKKRTIDFNIYDSFGIDNLLANIEYLLDKGVWTKTGRIIKVPSFDKEFSTSISDGSSTDQLIRFISDNNLEHEVDSIVGETWASIEDAIKIKRKKMFE